MSIVFHSANCSGCRICQLACSMQNFHLSSISESFLRVRGEFPTPGRYEVSFCDQCGACAEACPADAISCENGVYVIDRDNCIGCLACVSACPSQVMIVDKESGLPWKCTDCGICTRACPRGAIV